MKDNIKINRTRRQRGYAWERTLVHRFLNSPGDDWGAYRLGGASSYLPDVFAISNRRKKTVTIEAKSGTGDNLYVPAEQIKRCVDWSRNFLMYDRAVILAFKFSQIERTKATQMGSRKLKEWFFLHQENDVPQDLVCTYDGHLYERHEGGRLIKTSCIRCEAIEGFL